MQSRKRGLQGRRNEMRLTPFARLTSLKGVNIPVASRCVFASQKAVRKSTMFQSIWRQYKSAVLHQFCLLQTRRNRMY